jgi:hypothetical protein
MEQLRQAAIGISAAIVTPLWLRDSRLHKLLDGRDATAAPVQDPTTAVRSAFATLRVLGRVPLLPYRNTCLYRSIAECLALPRVGISCRLRIGVQRDGPACNAIEAHAWVEREGSPVTEMSHVPLA